MEMVADAGGWQRRATRAGRDLQQEGRDRRTPRRRENAENRGSGSPHIANSRVESSFDTVGIAFPISESYATEGASRTTHKYGTPEEKESWNRQLPHGGFLRTGFAGKAWVEASLPKRHGGDNVDGVGLGDALDLIEDMYNEACLFVEPDAGRDGDDWRAAKVIRLDLVRDFHEVASAGYVLDGLSMIRNDPRWKVKRYADPERARAESLRIGPGAWASTLYDKHAETCGLAPEGTLRYEARLHQEQLTGAGATMNGGHVRMVADIEEAKCQQLRRWMFDRVGFGREVVAVGRVQELVFKPCIYDKRGAVVEDTARVMNMRDRGATWEEVGAVFGLSKKVARSRWGILVDEDGLTKREQRELWAFITAGQRGSDIGFGRSAVTKYKAAAREVGITLSSTSAEFLDESRMVLQLDYESGTEILRAA